jgi:hypothetical protein
LVLRLLRAEALDAVSRESQVPGHELESWKRIFLEQGTRGLKSRSDPEERELTLARAKIGELMMDRSWADDREGTRPDDPAISARASGPGDRVVVLDQRGQLLRAALGFAGFPRSVVSTGTA